MEEGTRISVTNPVYRGGGAWEGGVSVFGGSSLTEPALFPGVFGKYFVVAKSLSRKY